MELITKKGVKFYISKDDFILVQGVNWTSCPRGYIKGYHKKYGKIIYLHRLIMGIIHDSTMVVDHKDRNPLNNTRSNLRTCNRSENQKNSLGRGSSIYKGVSVHKSKRKVTLKNGEVKTYESTPMFLSRIVLNGKQKHLGVFKNEIDAAKKYNEYAIKYHGEFARLNEI